MARALATIARSLAVERINAMVGNQQTGDSIVTSRNRGLQQAELHATIPVEEQVGW